MKLEVCKVVALFSGIFACAFILLALSSTHWVLASGYREGLFVHCIEENNEMLSLPFNLNEPPGCHSSWNKTYVKVTAGLCIASAIMCTLSIILTSVGLKKDNLNSKKILYIISSIIMFFSFFGILTALIVYPFYFATELQAGNRPIWEFGWGYIAGWGAPICNLLAIILLLCKRKS